MTLMSQKILKLILSTIFIGLIIVLFVLNHTMKNKYQKIVKILQDFEANLTDDAYFETTDGLQQQLNDMNLTSENLRNTMDLKLNQTDDKIQKLKLEVEESNNEMLKTINSTNTQVNSLDTRIGKDVAMIEACYDTKYWVTIKDKTRYYFGTELVTYHQAVDKCKDLCGKLFEPKDASTFTKVFSHTPHVAEKTFMWIGALFSQSELLSYWPTTYKKR
jgi:hypothetical protein